MTRFAPDPFDNPAAPPCFVTQHISNGTQPSHPPPLDSLFDSCRILYGCRAFDASVRPSISSFFMKSWKLKKNLSYVECERKRAQQNSCA
ncbi:hypothetical protein NECAME_19290, partial [Necator americanus]